VTLVPVGPQQAEDRRVTVRGGGGDKHWFGTFHFDLCFDHAESVRVIRAEAANDGAEQLRLEVSQDMLDYANSNPKLLNIVTTSDESPTSENASERDSI